MKTQTTEKEQATDVYNMLAAADKLAKHYEYLLDNCYLTKKDKFHGNVNDFRPKAEQLIAEFKDLRKGCS